MFDIKKRKDLSGSTVRGLTVLPENDISRAIARDAKTTGLLKILAYGREYSWYVQYLDSVRVIVS